MNDRLRKLVSAEILRLSTQGGERITPAHYVEEARNPASPLHDTLEWDDDKAAEAHRLSQARAWIRSVNVAFEIGEHTVYVPAFVRDPDAHSLEQGYIETKTICNDTKRKHEVVRRLLERVEGEVYKVRQFAEVFDIEDDVETLLAAVTRARERVEAA
jgi:hypothetical protein